MGAVNDYIVLAHAGEEGLSVFIPVFLIGLFFVAKSRRASRDDDDEERSNPDPSDAMDAERPRDGE